jgi:uncharacterized protein
MPLTEILYLHGFRSSSASRKAQQLRAFADARGLTARVTIPDLNPDPRLAVAFIDEFVTQRGVAAVTLVGSSLGGFYASVMAERHGCRAVLINPPVHPHTHLQRYIGPQTIYWTGGVFEFRMADVDALAALDINRITRCDRQWLLAEMGDATCDWQASSQLYRGCKQTIFAGGSHEMVHFSALLPAIFAYAKVFP